MPRESVHHAFGFDIDNAQEHRWPETHYLHRRSVGYRAFCAERWYG